MRISKRSSILFLLLCVLRPIVAQDTLKIFRFPPSDQVDVVVNARATDVGGRFRYEYEIRSLRTSKQDIWVIDMPFDNAPANIHAPEGWLSDVGGKMPTIQWGGRSAIYFIRPGQALSGFRYDSEDLPKIRIMYIEGWIAPPALTFEPDSVVGEDVLEASKKVLTIAAARPPDPFIPLAFLDTLISYKHQALALGWLRDKKDDDHDEDEQAEDGIIKNLDKRLDKARKELMKGDSVKARKELEKLVKKVEKIFKKSEEAEKKKREGEVTMTSEAYALLKFNAEYLIERLPEKSRERPKRNRD